MSSYAYIPFPVPQSYESITKSKGPVGPSSSFPTACYATHSVSHLPHYVPTACLLISLSRQVPIHLFPHIMFPLLVTWPPLLLLHVTHCNALRPLFRCLLPLGVTCVTQCVTRTFLPVFPLLVTCFAGVALGAQQAPGCAPK